MNLPSHQRGASVSGILIMTMLIVVCIKIGLAIIPAQIGHYQLKKSVITALKKSNDNKETGKQIIAVGMDYTRVNLDLVKDGQIFGCLKFRSMICNADAVLTVASEPN